MGSNVEGSQNQNLCTRFKSSYIRAKCLSCWSKVSSKVLSKLYIKITFRKIIKKSEQIQLQDKRNNDRLLAKLEEAVIYIT